MSDQVDVSLSSREDCSDVCSSTPTLTGSKTSPLVHTVNLKTEMTRWTLKTKKILMTILSSSLHIFHYDYQACMQVISGLIIIIILLI